MITPHGPFDHESSGGATVADPSIYKDAYEFDAADVTDGYLPSTDQIVTCYYITKPQSVGSMQSLSGADTLPDFLLATTTLVSSPGGGSGTNPNSDTSSAEKIYTPLLVALIAIGWLMT